MLNVCLTIVAAMGAAEAGADHAAIKTEIRAGHKRVLCRRAKPAPKIDADLSDWDMVKGAITINADTLRRAGKVDGSWDGDKDSSAVVAVAWDSKFFYVAARVKDDHTAPLVKRIDPWVSGGVPRDAPWRHDSVMLYFRAIGWVSDTGRFDDRITVPMLSHPFFGVTLTAPAAKGAFLPKNARSASKQTPDGYIVEAALPMARMGYRPQVGDRVRFALIVVDPDPKQWGQLCYLWDTDGSNDERYWGDLRFVDEAGSAGGELLIGQDIHTVGQDVVLKAQVDAAVPGVAFQGFAVEGPKGRRVIVEANRAVKPNTTLAATGVLKTAGWAAGTYKVKLLTQGATVAPATFQLASQQPPAAKPDIRVKMTRDDSRHNGKWKPPFSMRLAPLPEDITTADYLRWLRERFANVVTYSEDCLRNKRFDAFNPFTDGAYWYSFFYHVEGLERYAERACEMIRCYPKLKRPAANFHTVPEYYDVDRWLAGSKAYTAEVRGVFVGSLRQAYAGGLPAHVERGAMNRSMHAAMDGEIAMKLVPDLPDRKRWRAYADAVWHDWWDYRDTNENSTNYVAINFDIILRWSKVRGVEKEVFADPGIRRLFERYMWQTMPNGVFPSYGDSVPHNTTWGSWVAFFEVAATRFKDGRFKWMAHRLWYHANSHCENLFNWHYLWGFAAKRLMSNFDDITDQVRAVRPTGKLTYLERPRMEILTHAEKRKRKTSFVLHPDLIPAKLMMRAGWGAQDLAAWIDLTPNSGHSVSPVPAVSCLTSRDAVLLHELGYIEKGPEYHNVVNLEDMEGITPVAEPEKVTMLDKAEFRSGAYARVSIANYKAWPVTAQREFFLVGNRLLWVKDKVRFDKPFRTRLGPNWQVKVTGPDHGPNWVNTYIDVVRTRGIKGPILGRWFNPLQDLLIYYLPRPDCTLEVIDRTRDDATQLLPQRVRYRWSGAPSAGAVQHFSTLLIPHRPVPKAKAIADQITTLLDNTDSSAVRIVDGPATEWLAVNPVGAAINVKGFVTDGRVVYVRRLGDRFTHVLARDATRLRVAGESLVQSGKRTTVDRQVRAHGPNIKAGACACCGPARAEP